jgi:hypothetical protein
MAKPKFYTRTGLLKLAGFHHSAAKFTGRKALAALERILMVVPRREYDHTTWITFPGDSGRIFLDSKLWKALRLPLPDFAKQVASCGTAACAGGFGAIAFRGGRCGAAELGGSSNAGSVFNDEALAGFYGITPDEAREIFFYTEKEDDAGRELGQRTPKQTAAIIRRVLKGYAKQEKKR